MKRMWILAALGALALTSTVRADDKKDDKAATPPDGPPASTQAQIDAMDQGADSIDVSKYPEIQQKNYKTFAQKCSKCHTLARPINSPYALPDEWAAYVTKMSKKRGSGLAGDSDEMKATRQKIIDFLSYDSSVRKKEIIAQKLKGKKAAASDASANKGKSDAGAAADAKPVDKKDAASPKTAQ